MCGWYRYRLLLLVLAMAGGFMFAPAAARGHAGVSLALKIDITDEAVAYDILISSDLYRLWFTTDRSKLNLAEDDALQVYRFLDPDEARRERDQVERFFKDRNPVTIDGVRVRPILDRLSFVYAKDPVTQIALTSLPPDLHVTFRHPTKVSPKKVSMIWDVFPPDIRKLDANPNAVIEVWAELDAFGENILVFFSEAEPEMIWHARGASGAKKVEPVLASARPRGIGVPLVSAGLVACWGGVLLGFRLSRRWKALRRRLLTLSVLPIAAALFCHDVLVAPVSPPWRPRISPPGEAGAIDIFTALHANIYRAFDYKTESDVYDVLAQSVAGGMLDGVYNEVYQSLIMRDQGGAVARVQSVEMIDVAALSSGTMPHADGPAFRVRCRWRVHGAVAHWGHIHARTNEYEATYTVSQQDGRWKITGVEILEQHRVVPEEGVDDSDEAEDADDDAPAEDEEEDAAEGPEADNDTLDADEESSG